ncbi:hypothetical protein [Salibacterium halotolerans]|uniref:Uncharacterized protein n=1 Tax=Salibacterium halotolerans TaxID=1884432 RepID=A0A1I5Y797_9BACI|nr:hypothetical protein [Salibacterium halotolerans]SFQ40054.1 hypothetical protein SAMN05518683_1377 [Salibacterium halotolerans]
MKKLSVAAGSSLIFAAIFAAIGSWLSYVPNSQREPDIYYPTFFDEFRFALIFAGPVFFLIGIPLSIIIDRKGRSKPLRYFVLLGLYSVVGLLIGTFYYVMFFTALYPSAGILFAILGFFASNLYFHLLLGITKIKMKG